MTMPNLLLNTIPHEGENDEEERWIPIPRVFTSRFFAGDWGSMKVCFRLYAQSTMLTGYIELESPRV